MKRTGIIRILLFLTAGLLSINNSDAIPAFARKYQISCQVCHSPAMPRLKAFGDEFAGNGFRMTEYESPRHFIETGDDRLSLFRELPVAIRIDGYGTYNFADQEKTDIAAPFVMKILSGGEISDKLSYYFYFLFSERGEIAGLEDALLVYTDFLGTGINLTLGQFAVSDPLFKSELRYTLEPYKIYSAKPGTSTTDLKYDKGLVFDKGFSTGTTVVGQIVNGNGIGEADNGYLFDKDKYKNFMLRVNQEIGQFITIGFFGYTGREEINDVIYAGFVSDIRMFGPDITFDFNERFMLSAQFVKRTDSRVFMEGFPSEMMEDVETMGAFAELIFSPRGDMSKWYLTSLINWVESDYDPLDYASATLHAGYLLRRNVRVVGEFTQQFRGPDYGKVSFGVVTAF
ncbi:MAG TPA: hypothetical protein PK106_08870 [Bacteroidales bacterium]|nr:hypothetical protein [Bacteroidales bacterium]